MKKKKIEIKQCGFCNRWYNGCYDTDYDFWMGERIVSNCVYYEEKVYDTASVKKK